MIRKKTGFTFAEAVVVIAIMTMITATAFLSLKRDDNNDENKGRASLSKMIDISDSFYMSYGELPSISDISGKDKITIYSTSASNSITNISYFIDTTKVVGAIYTRIGCYYVKRNYEPNSGEASLLWLFKSNGNNCQASDVTSYNSISSDRGGSENNPILI